MFLNLSLSPHVHTVSNIIGHPVVTDSPSVGLHLYTGICSTYTGYVLNRQIIYSLLIEIQLFIQLITD